MFSQSVYVFLCLPLLSYLPLFTPFLCLFIPLSLSLLSSLLSPLCLNIFQAVSLNQSQRNGKIWIKRKKVFQYFFSLIFNFKSNYHHKEDYDLFTNYPLIMDDGDINGKSDSWMNSKLLTAIIWSIFKSNVYHDGVDDYNYGDPMNECKWKVDKLKLVVCFNRQHLVDLIQCRRIFCEKMVVLFLERH